MPVGTTVTGADDVHWPIIQYGNCYILPGLPVALRAKVDRIVGILPAQPPNWIARIFLTVDENDFAEQLAAFQEARPELSIGSYPVVGEADYRAYITIKSRNAERVRQALAELTAELGGDEWIAYTEQPRRSNEVTRAGAPGNAGGGSGTGRAAAKQQEQ